MAKTSTSTSATKTTTVKKTGTSIESTEVEVNEMEENMESKTVPSNDAILREEYEKLLAQVQQLTQLVNTNMTHTESAPYTNSMEKEVVVVNMCMGELNLATEGNGKGTIYNFKHFNQALDIPFGDLKDIVRNNARFVDEGYFYIADAEAVKRLRKAYNYKKILEPATIANIFDYDSSTIVSMYKDAPRGQQELIVQMIRDKRLNAEKVDANVMMELGELTGIDFLGMEPIAHN